jgi:transcriptional regulator with XRE-family HTH domain
MGRMRQHHYIKAWRKYYNLTVQQLADRIERDKGTLSKIENFKLAYTQESLEAIAEAIGHNLEAADLLSPPPNPERPEDDLTRHLRKLKTQEDRAKAARILAAAFGDGTNG